MMVHRVNNCFLYPYAIDNPQYYFCISFAAFAYVNLNDKDAWLWISIYPVASISCGLAVFGNFRLYFI